MRVLWITNTIFPAVCQELGISPPVVGGWMYAGANALRNEYHQVQLGVASLYSGDQLRTMKFDGIHYFLIPQPQKDIVLSQELKSAWLKVKEQFRPDVVHIHGSEYPHGLAYVNACGNDNVVVSIQGLVSVYERYYFGGISEKVLHKNITLRDRVRRDSIFKQHLKMKERGEWEQALIQKVKHVVGRTSWDKAHAWAINPKANYHFCNETLRAEFYEHTWDETKCEKYSIFLSQAHYPIKGLQQMIKALPLILRHFPDAKVYVAGNDFVTQPKKWRLNGFAKYIRSLIKATGVENQIVFTGLLQEKEMCQRYLKSHVFVCPSSIENSPNSVGEAQLLGVPCVASFVGGVPDMVVNEESGLMYRFEETEMLAKAVCRIFSNSELAKKISRNGQIVARDRHNPKSNTESLNLIYNRICKE